MSYKSENVLETFSFKDAYITHFEFDGKQMDIALDGVIIRAENENNANFTDSYAKGFVLSLEDVQIKGAYKEGFKYYDANDVLLREVPNEDMEVSAFLKLLKSLEEPYFYGVKKLTSEGEDYFYEFGIEERCELEAGSTYWFQVQYKNAVTTWEGYLNRVQY